MLLKGMEEMSYLMWGGFKLTSNDLQIDDYGFMHIKQKASNPGNTVVATNSVLDL